jgi:anti-anti-sigma regulatory factor
MGEVRVLDRGGREITVFLVGEVGSMLAAEFDAALVEVETLTSVDQVDRVVVDLQGVTAMDQQAVTFLQALQQRGGDRGFDVDLTTISGPAHRALEQANWPVGIGSMPGASEPRTPSGKASQKSKDDDFLGG